VGFKDKYHSELEKSSKYVAREAEAKALLTRNLGRLGIRVLEGDSSFVGIQGKVEGNPEVRFDFALEYPISPGRSLLLGYVEVTGDSEDSEFLYVLSEKIAKARRVDVPVWFLYFKDKQRKRYVIRAQTVVRYGTLVNWVPGERPYYRVPAAKAMSFRHWVLWFGDFVVRLVDQGKWFEVKAALTRW